MIISFGWNIKYDCVGRAVYCFYPNSVLAGILFPLCIFQQLNYFNFYNDDEDFFVVQNIKEIIVKFHSCNFWIKKLNLLIFERKNLLSETEMKFHAN